MVIVEEIVAQGELHRAWDSEALKTLAKVSSLRERRWQYQRRHDSFASCSIQRITGCVHESKSVTTKMRHGGGKKGSPD